MSGVGSLTWFKLIVLALAGCPRLSLFLFFSLLPCPVDGPSNEVSSGVNEKVDEGLKDLRKERVGVVAEPQAPAHLERFSECSWRQCIIVDRWMLSTFDNILVLVWMHEAPFDRCECMTALYPEVNEQATPASLGARGS